MKTIWVIVLATGLNLEPETQVFGPIQVDHAPELGQLYYGSREECEYILIAKKFEEYWQVARTARGGLGVSRSNSVQIASYSCMAVTLSE